MPKQHRSSETEMSIQDEDGDRIPHYAYTYSYTYIYIYINIYTHTHTYVQYTYTSVGCLYTPVQKLSVFARIMFGFFYFHFGTVKGKVEKVLIHHHFILA